MDRLTGLKPDQTTFESNRRLRQLKICNARLVTLASGLFYDCIARSVQDFNTGIGWGIFCYEANNNATWRILPRSQMAGDCWRMEMKLRAEEGPICKRT